MAEIRLERLSKSYDAARAPSLLPLDLEFRSGELVVLVGPSGCGKSTTLRLVAGLETATAGDVFIDGRRVTEAPPSERDVAMVFQSYALYPHLTVYENLAFALRMRRVPPAVMDRRVREAATALALDGLLGRRPKQLSGGQRQRVAIGRAVVRDPKVFLFDEPLSNLDAQLRVEMRQEIARIHARSKATSVYVTHDQTEAMTLADRIVVMKDGAVQQVGTPLELYDEPRNLFVASFLGSPSMNFIRGKLTDAGRMAEIAGLITPLPHPVRDVRSPEVLLGVRPQDLSLTPRGREQAISARVETRELTGGEAYVHLSSPAGALVLRSDAHRAPRPGEKVDVFIDPLKVHLFHPDSGLRL